METSIDSIDLLIPGFSFTFDYFGGTDYFNMSPTDSEKAGYYTAMALTFITPGGAEAKVEQYTLRAVESGFYPVMKRGFRKAQELVWLEKGEIWKIGTTKNFNPFKRYSKSYLDNIGEYGVQRFQEFVGTSAEALQLEKMKIINYMEMHGYLPAGNKMIK